MKKRSLIRKPTRLQDVSFDDLFDDDSSWELKAEQLLARRMRKFKRQLS